MWGCCNSVHQDSVFHTQLAGCWQPQPAAQPDVRLAAHNCLLPLGLRPCSHWGRAGLAAAARQPHGPGQQRGPAPGWHHCCIRRPAGGRHSEGPRWRAHWAADGCRHAAGGRWVGGRLGRHRAVVCRRGLAVGRQAERRSLACRACHSNRAHRSADTSRLTDHIPPLSVAQRRAALEAAAQHALSRGITMVHDMGRWAQWRSWLDVGNPRWRLQRECAPWQAWMHGVRSPPSSAARSDTCRDRHTARSLPCTRWPLRIAFMDGAEAAWDDLEQVGASRRWHV